MYGEVLPRADAATLVAAADMAENMKSLKQVHTVRTDPYTAVKNFFITKKQGGFFFPPLFLPY